MLTWRASERLSYELVDAAIRAASKQPGYDDDTSQAETITLDGDDVVVLVTW